MDSHLTTMGGAGNDFVSIISPSARWETSKLPEDNIYSKVHTRWWGMTMHAEEQTQPQQSPPLKQSSIAETQSHVADMDIDVDSDDEKSASPSRDDVLPGCYVLNVEPFENNRIWIRAEYIRIFDYILKYLEDDHGLRQRKASVIILTGQPGIGKTVWRLYALRRCLAEGRPVLYYNEGTCYLYVSDGVFPLPENFSAWNDFKKPVLALMDSMHHPNGLPINLITPDSRIRVIYTTSPTKSRWQSLHQALERLMLVMNPWTLWEIHQVAPLHLSTPDLGFVNDLYKKLGPTPRICVELPSFPQQLEEYSEALTDSIEKLDYSKLQLEVSRHKTLDMTAVGHKMFLIRRRGDQLSGLAEVTPISEYVSSLISERARGFKKNERLRLMQLFSTTARGLVGNLFEPYAQDMFGKEIAIEYYPMIRLKGGPNAKRKHQWHSVHNPLENHDLEAMRQQALAQKVGLKIKPTSTVVYTESVEWLDIQPDVFYIPKSSNQVALDSFIVHKAYLYMFQFTVSGHHHIKDGLISFLEKCNNLPSKKNWVFMFVTPDDVKTLKCPLPTVPELQEVIFSAVLDVMVRRNLEE